MQPASGSSGSCQTAHVPGPVLLMAVGPAVEEQLLSGRSEMCCLESNGAVFVRGRPQAALQALKLEVSFV